MSENAAVEKVALGTGAREAVDGDLSKSYVPADVDPTATGVKAQDVPAPKTDTGPTAQGSSPGANQPADKPADKPGGSA